MSKNIKVGFPLGIKVNEDEVIDGTVNLDELLQITELYHGNKYVIGKDTLFCEKPHFHIHFFSIKETSDGALKTFRSNVIKKKFPNISKSFRLYAGQDLPSAKSTNWLSYAIKESIYRVNNIEVSDDIIIDAKAHLEVKKLKKVHSEKKAIDEKEKKDFKEKMFEYVLQNIPDYQTYDKSNPFYANEEKAFGVTVIDYLVKCEKYGSIKKIFIRQWYLEYKVKYSPNKWSAIDIYQSFS